MLDVIELTESALLSMVLTAAEVYKKECYGFLIGKKHGKTYRIMAAVSHQKATRQFRAVYIDDHTPKLVRNVVQDMSMPRYRLIGEFHSHPQFGRHRGIAVLSKYDTLDVHGVIQIVIAANDVKRRKKKWRVNKDGTISGIVNNVSMTFRAFLVEKGETPKLPLICKFLQ